MARGSTVTQTVVEAEAPPTEEIPWIWILVLGGLLLVGGIAFKKRKE